VGIELSCPDFDEYALSPRYPNHCSPGCSDGIKLFITPKLHGSSIHANVCSGRYEFVKSLSREWWARKAAGVLGWDESKIRQQIDPVWAMKVQNANIAADWKPDAKGTRRSSGPSCIYCGGRVAKGDQVCLTCINKSDKPTVDPGSLDDLDF
jgi:hypothetical protein